MNNKKLFILVVTVMMLLALSVAANAEPSANCWDNGWWDYGWNNNNYNYGGCNYGWSYYNCAGNYTRPYQAEFVTDVNYPDGSYVTPGQRFLKTWRLRNVGNCTWGNGTSLVLVSGDPMGAGNCVRLPYSVAPGQTVDVSVTFVAPSSPSMGRSEWMLQAPDGTRFGVGCNGNTNIWVSVSTWSGNYGTPCWCAGMSDCYCSPCAGGNCSPSGSRTGKNPYCNNKIRNVKDITIPDASIIEPGAIFRKTWRMKNGGTCVWDENYLMTFVGGDNLGGAEFVRLNSLNVIPGEYRDKRSRGKVYPGDSVEISIDLQAPTTPGVYQSYYKLRDNMGYEFGFGSYAAEPFWVKITVPESTTKSAAIGDPLPEGNPEAIAAAKAATAAAEQIESVDAPADGDETVLNAVVEKANDCEVANPSLNKTETGYDVSLTITNTGTSDWADGKYHLLLTDSSDYVSLDGEIALPEIASGASETVSFSVDLLEGAADSAEPQWLEFKISDGTEDFHKFYFEIPNK